MQHKPFKSYNCDVAVEVSCKSVIPYKSQLHVLDPSNAFIFSWITFPSSSNSSLLLFAISSNCLLVFLDARMRQQKLQNVTIVSTRLLYLYYNLVSLDYQNGFSSACTLCWQNVSLLARTLSWCWGIHTGYFLCVVHLQTLVVGLISYELGLIQENIQILTTLSGWLLVAC